MIWNRLQFAFGAGLGCALLCSPGCGSDAPSAAPSASGVSAGVGGALGMAGSAVAGSAVAGVANNAGRAGAVSVAGAAGASVAGAGGSAGSAGAPVSVSSCHARPGLLACEDFEAAAVGAVPAGAWSAGLVGDGGSVVVDDSVPAHSGSKAVHIHGAGYQALLVYHDATVLPQATGKFYVRAFLRLAEPMVGGHNTFMIADTFAAPGAGNSLRVGEQNNMLM